MMSCLPGPSAKCIKAVREVVRVLAVSHGPFISNQTAFVLIERPECEVRSLSQAWEERRHTQESYMAEKDSVSSKVG